jgi:hypothetical protein
MKMESREKYAPEYAHHRSGPVVRGRALCRIALYGQPGTKDRSQNAR